MVYTVSQTLHCSGTGVHSGKKITLTLKPAPLGTGIMFRRTDLTTQDTDIPATWENISNTRFNTTLSNSNGLSISTVEHILAALSASNIRHVYVEVDGPEIPIMDGSAAPFQFLIDCARCVPLADEQEVIVLHDRLEAQTDYGARMILEPSESLSITVEHDFKGRQGLTSQRYTLTNLEHHFRTTIAPARTFGFYEDAQKMWDAGLSQGSSLQNTLVYDEGQIMNKDGARFHEECARHKVLDIIGDFTLAGAPLQAALTAINPGHHLNYLMLKKLMETPEAWSYQTQKVSPSPEFIAVQLPSKKTACAG